MKKLEKNDLEEGMLDSSLTISQGPRYSRSFSSYSLKSDDDDSFAQPRGRATSEPDPFTNIDWKFDELPNKSSPSAEKKSKRNDKSKTKKIRSLQKFKLEESDEFEKGNLSKNEGSDVNSCDDVDIIDGSKRYFIRASNSVSPNMYHRASLPVNLGKSQINPIPKPPRSSMRSLRKNSKGGKGLTVSFDDSPIEIQSADDLLYELSIENEIDESNELINEGCSKEDEEESYFDDKDKDLPKETLLVKDSDEHKQEQDIEPESQEENQVSEYNSSDSSQSDMESSYDVMIAGLKMGHDLSLETPKTVEPANNDKEKIDSDNISLISVTPLGDEKNSNEKEISCKEYEVSTNGKEISYDNENIDIFPSDTLTEIIKKRERQNLTSNVSELENVPKPEDHETKTEFSNLLDIDEKENDMSDTELDIANLVNHLASKNMNKNLNESCNKNLSDRELQEDRSLDDKIEIVKSDESVKKMNLPEKVLHNKIFSSKNRKGSIKLNNPNTSENLKNGNKKEKLEETVGSSTSLSSISGKKQPKEKTKGSKLSIKKDKNASSKPSISHDSKVEQKSNAKSSSKLVTRSIPRFRSKSTKNKSTVNNQKSDSTKSNSNESSKTDSTENEKEPSKPFLKSKVSRFSFRSSKKSTNKAKELTKSKSEDLKEKKDPKKTELKNALPELEVNNLGDIDDHSSSLCFDGSELSKSNSESNNNIHEMKQRSKSASEKTSTSFLSGKIYMR